jgi:very-short-patch-repair endonuclease
MRREQTDAERKLWLLLRDRRLAGAKFRRQAPIGPYIADFICPRRKLIVEADGGQHIDDPSDVERDRWLAKKVTLLSVTAISTFSKTPRAFSAI